MGILISTGVLVGIYVIAVLIFDGTSTNMFDFPLPMGAVIGGSLLFSAIAFGPDGGPAGQPSPGATGAPKAPTSPATDRVVTVLVPVAGQNRPSIEQAFRIQSLVELRVKALFGEGYSHTLALWRGDPVPNIAAVKDDTSRIFHAGRFVEAMEAAGLSSSATTAFFRSGLRVEELGRTGLLMVTGTVPKDGSTGSPPEGASPPTVFGAMATPDMGPPIPRSKHAAEEETVTVPLAVSCDVCDRPIPKGGMVRVNANTMSRLVIDGYRPLQYSDDVVRLANEANMTPEDVWVRRTGVSKADWAVCPDCAGDIDRFSYDEPRGS